MLMPAQLPAHPSGGAMGSSAAGDYREATEDFVAQQRHGDDVGGTTPAPASSTGTGLDEHGEALTAETLTASAATSSTIDGDDSGCSKDSATAKGGDAPDSVPSVPAAAMDRDEGRVSTPPPPGEDDGGGRDDGGSSRSCLRGATTTAVTPSRPALSPLRFASPVRTESVASAVGGDGDLRDRVLELEQTVAALLEVLQAQQQQAPLMQRTPLRASLRPTASQLCLYPLDSPSPTPRSSKAIARERIGEQGVLSMPDLDEDNLDAAGNSTLLPRSPIPEPTPDLEYRTYTAEYEEELKKIRADRQRSMSFDVAEVVDRNIQEEADAEASAGSSSSSSGGSSSIKNSSQNSLDDVSPKKAQGEGRSESLLDDAADAAADGTKKEGSGKLGGLTSRALRRIRSTGELRRLDELLPATLGDLLPATLQRTNAGGGKGSPKGVEDGPSGESTDKETAQLGIPLPPDIASEEVTLKGNDKEKAEKETPPKKPTSTPPVRPPEASVAVSSQKPPKLAMTRTPKETAAVVAAIDQGKELSDATKKDVVKPTKEKSRKRGSEKTSDLHTSSPEVSKSTPKLAKKNGTPQPQKKAAEPPPQKAAPPEESMFSYIKNDLLSNMNLDSRQQDGSASEDVDANMQEFIKVPSKLESLLFFGLAICTDSFLYVLAFLPLKCLWSCICLFCTILRPGKGIRGCTFHRRHLYQILLTLVIVAVYRHVLVPISIGKMYHWIRGQAMVKLYVMIAIADVFDRLMCSLGQDSLDSLYWNTTRRPYHPRMVISTCVVFVYAALHSLVLFVHIGTLNVAMNSADQALLTLLISGNFAEIKSTVFKKYNKQNLFKITTSDICERFKLILFLSLILLLNCSQGGMNRHSIEQYMMVGGIVMFSEMICDWIKHSFITKFNFIKSSAYPDYALILAGDVTGVGHEGINLNHTHAIVKRLGFSQIPLVCVFARYIREALRYGMEMSGENGTGSEHFFERFAALYTNRNWSAIAAIVLGVFHCLLIMKIVLGYLVLKASRRLLHGPTPLKSEENSRPTEKTKGTNSGESAKQEKPGAPRRQAV